MKWHKAMKIDKLKQGKKKMISISRKLILITRTDEGYFASEALCRHMRWPLAYGGKIENGCIKCPLHQTKHNLDDGELIDWSPFPLFPPYGKLVGKFSKKKDLKMYDTRIKNGNLEVKIV
ncbi:MAG: hypothetical protein CMB56_004945 [Methanobacteriota archaeon]|nr:MAG: hypothetical protein CMB56_004945 [Euryarchaeota archaeon]